MMNGRLYIPITDKNGIKDLLGGHILFTYIRVFHAPLHFVSRADRTDISDERICLNNKSLIHNYQPTGWARSRPFPGSREDLGGRANSVTLLLLNCLIEQKFLFLIEKFIHKRCLQFILRFERFYVQK